MIDKLEQVCKYENRYEQNQVGKIKIDMNRPTQSGKYKPCRLNGTLEIFLKKFATKLAPVLSKLYNNLLLLARGLN